MARRLTKGPSCRWLFSARADGNSRPLKRPQHPAGCDDGGTSPYLTIPRGVSLGVVVVPDAEKWFLALWLSTDWQRAKLPKKRMWLECSTHFAFRGC